MRFTVTPTTKPAGPTPRPESAGKQETRGIKIVRTSELAVQHLTSSAAIDSPQPLIQCASDMLSP